MKKTVLSFLCVLSLCFVIACDQENKSESVPVVTKGKPEGPPNPFSFYKNIEIRPGLSFEAVAWGRGPDTVGGYSVYLTDTIHNNYKALTGERRGKLTGFWNLDLDTDGNPEIYLQFTRNQNESDLLVYEFDDNDFRKISFPSLSAKTRSMYLGNDKFSIREGGLFRTIPVRLDDGKTTEMKVYYELQGNSFVVKDAL